MDKRKATHRNPSNSCCADEIGNTDRVLALEKLACGSGNPNGAVTILALKRIGDALIKGSTGGKPRIP